MPKVYNKHHNDFPDGAVYIGRGSPWGNPYSHLESKDPSVILVESREESILRYKEHLDRNPHLVRSIKEELRGKDLVCFCAPSACHGDVILEIANDDLLS